MTQAPYFSHLFQAIGRAIRTEFQLFRRFPKLVPAVIAIAMVPAVYALIYLSSVWDPNAYTQALPVGLVSEDSGFVKKLTNYRYYELRIKASRKITAFATSYS